MKYNFELNEDGTVKSATWREDGDERYCYATNSYGDGVFKYDDYNAGSRQLTGTCQFSIYGLTKSSARRKIRSFMK